LKIDPLSASKTDPSLGKKYMFMKTDRHSLEMILQVKGAVLCLSPLGEPAAVWDIILNGKFQDCSICTCLATGNYFIDHLPAPISRG